MNRGRSAEDVGRFLFESYRNSGAYGRLAQVEGLTRAAAFTAWHLEWRQGWCDGVRAERNSRGYGVESISMLQNHDEVLGFHGVTRMDMEACLETFWRLSGQALGLEVTYTVGEEQDWLLVRTGEPAVKEIHPPQLSDDELLEHRRFAVATGIIASIGFARRYGDQAEDLGRFFFTVWDRSGHYERLREGWGFGNALAYAQSLAHGRQILYSSTRLEEDLDGYAVTSPSWATEIPQVMTIFRIQPQDVYRYFEGGGVAACARLGLQYADQSDERFHRVWIRSR
ncbi:MAG: hypothetical protein ACOY93_20290 [Bacillota bacterium]